MLLLYTLTQAVPLYTTKPVAVEYETIPADGEGIADERAAVPANTITICSIKYPLTSAAVSVSPGDQVFLPSPAIVPTVYATAKAVSSSGEESSKNGDTN